MTTTPKRPCDPNQLAKMVADLATGEAEEQKPKAEAQRKGGIKGGEVRTKVLTSQQRSEIATSAATAMWKKGS